MFDTRDILPAPPLQGRRGLLGDSQYPVGRFPSFTRGMSRHEVLDVDGLVSI
jgi:hypothetical protein